ncbi:N-formylglutamate deformylase [Sphingomonas sp.]|jgi:N-formylglutamate deformylase|uniref:N-formylglutamate deformylase n=1 Tax=Sphingomonas sp. TaxID=28214 RepID=UPI002DF0E9C8|nr:N-formylglutamate deformylase [Sphingomonas sp.]HEV2568190.1 N-formylglutamate deformylase [Sphingomonas sp.]
MMEPFRLTRGPAPLLVSFPHVGTYLPPEIAERLTPQARRVPDTDWFVDRLYDFVHELGASTIVATHSRYVVDVNRPPDDASLYPGQATTGIVPATRFDGSPLYLSGEEPCPHEVERRIASVWRPYHEALAGELERLKAVHGRVLLWEAHSIRQCVPLLFEGSLPDLNLGTNDGASARTGLGEQLLGIAAGSGYSAVLNGRFKGGFITRHYGRPEEGVNAVQLELVQKTYMDDAEKEFDEVRASRLRPVLRELIGSALRAP